MKILGLSLLILGVVLLWPAMGSQWWTAASAVLVGVGIGILIIGYDEWH